MVNSVNGTMYTSGDYSSYDDIYYANEAASDTSGSVFSGLVGTAAVATIATVTTMAIRGKNGNGGSWCKAVSNFFTETIPSFFKKSSSAKKEVTEQAAKGGGNTAGTVTKKNSSFDYSEQFKELAKNRNNDEMDLLLNDISVQYSQKAVDKYSKRNGVARVLNNVNKAKTNQEVLNALQSFPNAFKISDAFKVDGDDITVDFDLLDKTNQGKRFAQFMKLEDNKEKDMKNIIKEFLDTEEMYYLNKGDDYYLNGRHLYSDVGSNFLTTNLKVTKTLNNLKDQIRSCESMDDINKLLKQIDNQDWTDDVKLLAKKDLLDSYRYYGDLYDSINRLKNELQEQINKNDALKFLSKNEDASGLNSGVNEVIPNARYNDAIDNDAREAIDDFDEELGVSIIVKNDEPASIPQDCGSQETFRPMGAKYYV